MGNKTGIQWTDSTWNPTVGCSLVSAGCSNCYAMTTAHRFSGKGQYYEGTTRVSGGRGVWTGEILLKQEKLGQPLRWTKPRRVFVNSMSDVHHENIPKEYVAAIYGVMLASPKHQFQVLTKRPEKMLEFFQWMRDEVYPETSPGGYRDFLCSMAANQLCDGSVEDQKKWFWKLRDRCCPTTWPIPNVWLGVSAEDQKAADERIPVLLKVPAAIRFVSAEPLLGPLDLTCLHHDDIIAINALTGEGGVPYPHAKITNSLDWVIVGGESGPGHRPCKQEWVESLKDQCAEAGVAYFFKQKGEIWAKECGAQDKKGGNIEEFPEHLRVREFPATVGGVKWEL